VFGDGYPIRELAAEDVERGKRHGDILRGRESVEGRVRRRRSGEVLAVVVGRELLLLQSRDVQIGFHRGRVRLVLATGVVRYCDGSESADHHGYDQNLDQSEAFSHSHHLLLDRMKTTFWDGFSRLQFST